MDRVAKVGKDWLKGICLAERQYTVFSMSYCRFKVFTARLGPDLDMGSVLLV